MAEQNDQQELDLEVGGQKVRARGYRLLDLVWLPMIGMLAWLVITANQHESAAQTYRTTSVLSDKENAKALVDALKENNANTVAAIRELTVEQRRSTSAMKEVACIVDPAMQRRTDAREFCKRMQGDR